MSRNSAAGAIDTGYLDRHDPSALMAASAGADNSELHAVVAALAAQAERRAATSVLPGLPSGGAPCPAPISG